jgi:hypothetical protein
VLAVKVDHKRSLDSYRAERERFRIVEVPVLRYLMIDGHGDPNTSGEFSDAIAALYPVAYKLKFASRLQLGKDFTVMPLEGLWWSAEMESFTTERDKSRWDWTLMIMQPAWITPDLFAEAVRKVAERSPPAKLAQVRLEALDEGTCVQTLHVGPFDAEAPLLREMHERFIPDRSLEMTGKHHEVYFSDLRKTAPERLRTLLRQPVRSTREHAVTDGLALDRHFAEAGFKPGP